MRVRWSFLTIALAVALVPRPSARADINYHAEITGRWLGGTLGLLIVVLLAGLGLLQTQTGKTWLGLAERRGGFFWINACGGAVDASCANAHS
jgi:hypothetical protein